MAVLAGKTALVTGGSRGIGRAVVQRLGRDGATVVFSYARDEQAAGELVEIVAAAGARAVPVQADLADPSAAATLYADAEAELGALDILVNNAATNTVTPSIAETTDAVYDRIMRVNTRAVFALMRVASTRLREGGRIVNLSSINTVLPVPGGAAYAASKAAVEQFTAVAARELGPRGITVNAVSPGATDTDLLREVNPPDVLEDVIPSLTPLRRLGTPADVADVVAFLVGPDGRWMTGQNLRAGGGLP